MKFCPLLLLLFLSSSLLAPLSQEEVKEALRRQKESSMSQRTRDNLPPNLVLIKFAESKVHEMQVFSRIIAEFLSTIGVSSNIANISGNELVMTIPRGQQFDKKVLLDNFKDVIVSVDIADFTRNWREWMSRFRLGKLMCVGKKRLNWVDFCVF